jgi:hypothetical protein
VWSLFNNLNQWGIIEMRSSGVLMDLAKGLIVKLRYVQG